MENLFLTIKILGTSDFHLVCGLGFLEWIVKHKKLSLGLKKKKKHLYFLVQRGLHPSPLPILNDYPTPGEDGGG